MGGRGADLTMHAGSIYYSTAALSGQVWLNKKCQFALLGIKCCMTSSNLFPAETLRNVCVLIPGVHAVWTRTIGRKVHREREGLDVMLLKGNCTEIDFYSAKSRYFPKMSTPQFFPLVLSFNIFRCKFKRKRKIFSEFCFRSSNCDMWMFSSKNLNLMWDCALERDKCSKLNSSHKEPYKSVLGLRWIMFSYLII